MFPHTVILPSTHACGSVFTQQIAQKEFKVKFQGFKFMIIMLAFTTKKRFFFLNRGLELENQAVTVFLENKKGT